MTRKRAPQFLGVTSDGEFCPDDNQPYDYEGIPTIGGSVKIPISSEIREKIQDWRTDFPENDAFLAGRSGHVQVGINTLRDTNQPFVIEDNHVQIPVHIQSYLEGRAVDFLSLLRNEKRLRMARLLLGLQKNALSKKAVEKAIELEDIQINADHKINDDGSVSIRIDPVQYLLDEDQLQEKSFQRQVLHRGRNALIGHRVIEPLKDPVQANSLFIGGLAFSSGPYTAMLDEEIEPGIFHLRAGRVLDGFRSTGFQDTEDPSRQLEIWNNGHPGQDVEMNNKRITVRFYPPATSQAEDFSSWQRLSTAQKKRIHQHGVDFAQITGIDNPDFLEELFTGLGKETPIYGRILTNRGVSVIRRREHVLFQVNSAVRAATSTAHRQEQNTEAQNSFIEKLSHTKDRGRVLIAHDLPEDEADLQKLHEAGVRVFVFRSIGIGRTEDQNVYLTPSLYRKIWALTRQGASFYFEPKDTKEGQRQLREFYKGFWLLPQEKERFDQVEAVVNMYGTHKNGIFDNSEADIRQFFESLVAIHGKDKVAIAHGKGGGVMELSDRIARELGIFSIGVGISVESLGHGQANLKPEAMVDFRARDRHERQNLLDKMVTIPIFNLGGDGTVEEQGISTCSMKTEEGLPIPHIFIDTSNQPEHHFEGLKIMGKAVIRGVDGQSMGEEWVQNLKIFVRSYAEAAEVIRQFHKNPCAIWRKAKVPPKVIRGALIKHQEIAQEYDRPIPEFLLTAAKEYLQENEE